MIQVLDGVCANLIGGDGIPAKIAHIISLAILLIQIVVPILLIIWGMLDLGKAVMAQKEDEIKKGQQTFVKRVAAAVIVFFVIVIVKLVVGLVADDGNIIDCIDDVLNCKTVKNGACIIK